MSAASATPGLRVSAHQQLLPLVLVYHNKKQQATCTSWLWMLRHCQAVASSLLQSHLLLWRPLLLLPLRAAAALATS
jgi:hypothetical protein